MAVAEVNVVLDHNGNMLAKVSVKAKLILQTMKWYYQPEKRKMLKYIVWRKFEQENVKEEFKKYIELDLKNNYGVEGDVYGMKVCKVEFENGTVHVYYMFKTRKKKVQKEIVL